MMPKAVSSLEGINKQFFEESTGMSGDDLEILQRIDRGMRGEFEAKGGEKAFGMSFQNALAEGKLTIPKDMNLDQLSIMEKIAGDTLVATRSITQSLNGIIAGTLDTINRSVEYIGHLAGISTGQSGNMKARKQDLSTESMFSQISVEAYKQIEQHRKGRADSGQQVDREFISRKESEAAQAQEQAKFYGTRAQIQGEGGYSYSNKRLQGVPLADKTAQVFGYGGANQDSQVTRAASGQVFSGLDYETFNRMGQSGKANRYARNMQSQMSWAQDQTAKGGMTRSQITDMTGDTHGHMASGYTQDMGRDDLLNDIVLEAGDEALAQKGYSKDEIKAIQKLGDDFVTAIKDDASKATARKVVESLVLGGAKSEDLRGLYQDGVAQNDVLEAALKKTGGGTREAGTGRYIATEAERAFYAGTGFKIGNDGTFNDWFYDGELHKINPNDSTSFGALPNGPLSRAMSSGSGGNNVTIQIVGNQAEIVRTLNTYFQKRGL